jgi:hypothetical protein
MPPFQQNDQDVYALHIFHQFAAELERHCVGVYFTNRNLLQALHNVLVEANDDIRTLKMNAAPQCSADTDCPPLHVCNGGECEVVFWPEQLSPAPQREKPPMG